MSPHFYNVEIAEEHDIVHQRVKEQIGRNTVFCAKQLLHDGVDQVFNLTRLSLSQASGDYTESIARLGGTIFDNTLVIPLRDSQSTVSPLGRLFPTIELTTCLFTLIIYKK